MSAIPGHEGRLPSWKTFVWQKGFRVILAGDAEGTKPVLMEAAFGKGRIVLASLHLDKITRENGTKKATPDQIKIFLRFFRNVALRGECPGRLRTPRPADLLTG